MVTAEQKAHRAKLHMDWALANQNARVLQNALIEAYAKCAAGKGQGPSDELLAAMAKANREVDNAAQIEDAYINKMLG